MEVIRRVLLSVSDDSDAAEWSRIHFFIVFDLLKEIFLLCVHTILTFSLKYDQINVVVVWRARVRGSGKQMAQTTTHGAEQKTRSDTHVTHCIIYRSIVG